MQVSSKYIGIVIGILVLVVLSSGCDEILKTNLDDPNNHTFSDYGVSFNYPENWSVSDDDEINIWIEARPDPVNNSTSAPRSFVTVNNTTAYYTPELIIDISPNNGMSDQESIKEAKKSMPNDANRISNSTLIISGTKAYKSVFVFSDQSREEYIYFLKNGKICVITIKVANKEYDKEKKNFDIILNSFEVQ